MEGVRNILNQSLPFVFLTNSHMILEILEFPLSSYQHYMILTEVVTGQRKRTIEAWTDLNGNGALWIESDILPYNGKSVVDPLAGTSDL